MNKKHENQMWGNGYTGTKMEQLVHIKISKLFHSQVLQGKKWEFNVSLGLFSSENFHFDSTEN